jgi:uncharacterized protein YkwD
MLVRSLLVAVLTAVLTLAAGVSQASAGALQGCPGGALTPTEQTLGEVRAATLCLVNRERAQRGLRALRADASLERVASGYAGRMVEQDFFAHVAPDGSSMVDRIRGTAYLRGGVKRWAVGENLAWGAGRRATPIQTVAAWMRSPGHRANILDRTWNEIGVGVVTGAPVRGHARAATYVANFGQRIR